MINLSKKQTSIELGGHYPPMATAKRVGALQSPTKSSQPQPSQTLIESTHRIPVKLTPKKTHARGTHSRLYQNEGSRTELSQSKLTVQSPRGESRVMLDRSNIGSPTKIQISYSNSNRNSPASSASRNKSPLTLKPAVVAAHHARTESQCPSASRHEAQLSRKLKILQTRIGELHRQKQVALAKLNEENRKVYHQNTSLKLRISALNKQLQATESTGQDFLMEKPVEQNDREVQLELENEQLREEIEAMEKTLTSQQTQLQELTMAHQLLSNEKSKMESLYSISQGQLEQLKAQYVQQVTQRQSVQSQLQNISSELENSKTARQALDSELSQLRSNWDQSEQHYVRLLAECRTKLDEYQSAYDQNQLLIQQLNEEVAAQQHPAVITEAPLEESFAQHSLDSECQLLEDNLGKAIEERDKLIETLEHQKLQLQQRNKSLQEQNLLHNESIQELSECQEVKTQQLEQASLLLAQMTSKAEELSTQYADLNCRFEAQQALNKTEGFQTKCKKCEDLLKTVLRLNQQLNPKRLQV